MSRRYSPVPMSSAHRKLSRVGERLRVAREELVVAEAQLVFFEEEGAELRVRGLVSDQVMDRRAAEEALRTEAKARRHRDRVVAEVARLQAEADALLDAMTEVR